MLSLSEYKKTLDKILQIFENDHVNEILINGTRGCVLIAQEERLEKPSFFVENSQARNWIQEFSFQQGSRLDLRHASQGGLMEGTSFRWHAMISPITVEPIFSLRRHRFQSISSRDFKMIPKYSRWLHELAVLERPLFFCGPTGAGKTTLMVALIREYLQEHRIFFLESLREIPSFSLHHLMVSSNQALEFNDSGLSLEKIVYDCLRLHPDRFVIGEIRYDSILAFWECLISGHSSVWTTMHADSVEVAIRKLSQLQQYAQLNGGELIKVLEHMKAVMIFIERGFPPRIKSMVSLEKK